jgi:cytochrome c-type biogenesis protein CcmH/NrfG
MTQFYASVATGTAATLMAITLLLLRLNLQGRRPVVALMRRWVATGTRNSGLVLALISAIAVYSFARIPAHELNEPNSTSALSASVPSAQSSTNDSNESSPADQTALKALRAYADKIAPDSQSTAAMSATPESATLPDVDVMIAKLVARLEKQPDDVKGWKMLGWSYLNTEKPEDAVRAYETALKLEPSDDEIRKGLEAAKAAQTAITTTPASDLATSPAADNPKAPEGSSDAQRDTMIRGMVSQLAARLETSPNDEDGWLLMMRSRTTLGEKDAAKAALTKALEVFASDAAVKARLTAAARELGVESN